MRISATSKPGYKPSLIRLNPSKIEVMWLVSASQLAKVRFDEVPLLEAVKTFTQAFICRRLDYCNILYCGIVEEILNRLQSVQNAAARLVTGRPVITPVYHPPPTVTAYLTSTCAVNDSDVGSSLASRNCTAVRQPITSRKVSLHFNFWSAIWQNPGHVTLQRRPYQLTTSLIVRNIIFNSLIYITGNWNACIWKSVLILTLVLSAGDHRPLVCERARRRPT